jgi:hypothetical protein
VDESVSKTIRHVLIAIVITVGVTLNTLLLKGAGGSRDTVYLQDRIDLHIEQTQKQLRQNLEYLEARIAKAEARQDGYYNTLNRRLDIVENKYDRVLNNSIMARTSVQVNNTFSPNTVIENKNK